jgi:CHAT domain-containing protein/tetratricopeptide (TPR) repeat protein
MGQAETVLLASLSNSGDADQILAKFAGNPYVEIEGTWAKIDEQHANVLLERLQEQQPLQYRNLHQIALEYLVAEICKGNDAAEKQWIAIFERLGNYLLTDPERFIHLVDTMQDVPLREARGQQIRQFFQAVAYRKMDHFSEALDTFDILLADSDLSEQMRGRVLNSRATCSRLMGKSEEAIETYRASIELWRKLGNVLREGLAQMNLGIVYYQLQNYDAADERLQRAIQCFETAGSLQWKASAENELGLLKRDQGQYSQAIIHFERFVAQRRKEDAGDEVGRGLNNIGEVLLFQGQIEDAVETLKVSLSQMTTLVYKIDTYMHLGLAYQAVGDLSEAREALRQALEIATTIKRRDILPYAHFLLAKALRRQGDGGAALDHLRTAADLIENSREPMRDESLKISLLGRWQQVYETLILHLLSMGLEREAFVWCERARARAFADAVGSGRREDGGVSQIGMRNPQLAIVSVMDVQNWLPRGHALLSYFTTGVLARDIPMLRRFPVDNPLREHLLTPARTILFAITSQSFSVRQLSFDPNTLASSSPRHQDRSRFLHPTVLSALHRSLLAPAADVLHARHLHIVPHGPIHQIPFAALGDARQRALLRPGGPALSYATSATLLLRKLAVGPAARTDSPLPCLAVGYNGSQPQRALRHIEPEARFVASLLGGEAWVGPDITAGALREAVRGRRWLHFACHGQFSSGDALDSFLEIGEGERLTARDVLETWRLQAELVTLSACQSGVSKVLPSDESMGLIRAFLVAGARAVLVSQWRVEDLPTFLLMQRFYTLLRQTDVDHPAVALRDAQLWLRDLSAAAVRAHLRQPISEGFAFGESSALAALPSDTRPFAAPRHWAAFVVVT